jgi:DNA-binding NarL/FixJ family response regulator
MMSRAGREHDCIHRLTARQRQVLTLVAEGRSNSAIARRLGISERGTVQHMSNIYAALGLPDTEDDHRRVLAVLRFLAR